MRFLTIVLSLFFLAIGVLLAVVDATRSIAANDWVYTPLAETWQAYAPSLLDSLEVATKAGSASFLWEKLISPALQAPGWATFFVLAFIVYLASWRRKKRDPFAYSFR